MSRERERCEYPDCGLIRAASVHVGYGEDKHEYLGPVKAGWGSQKKALAPRSEKMADYYERPGGRRDRVAEAVGDGRRPCKVQSPVCTGNTGQSFMTCDSCGERIEFEYVFSKRSEPQPAPIEEQEAPARLSGGLGVEYRIVSRTSGRELESPGSYERAVDGMGFFGSEGRMESRLVGHWEPAQPGVREQEATSEREWPTARMCVCRHSYESHDAAGCIEDNPAATREALES